MQIHDKAPFQREIPFQPRSLVQTKYELHITACDIVGKPIATRPRNAIVLLPAKSIGLVCACNPNWPDERIVLIGGQLYSIHKLRLTQIVTRKDKL